MYRCAHLVLHKANVEMFFDLSRSLGAVRGMWKILLARAYLKKVAEAAPWSIDSISAGLMKEITDKAPTPTWPAGDGA